MAEPVANNLKFFGWLRASWRLVTFTSIKILKQRRMLLILLLLGVPFIIGVALRSMGSVHNWEMIYWWMTLRLNQMGSLALLLMLFFTSLMSHEASEGTLVYLLTRRLTRPFVLLCKYLGTVFTVMLLSTIAQVSFFVVIYTAVPGQAPDWTALWLALLGNSLLIVVMGALFTLTGLVLSKPLSIGIIYVLVLEIFLGTRALNVQKFSILYTIRTLLLSIHKFENNFKFTKEIATPMQCWITLGAIVLVSLGISLWIVRSREFNWRSDK